MSKLAALLLALAVAVVSAATSGCTTKGSIKADAIDVLVMKVSDRHDRYVTADPALSEGEKADFLRSTEILRKVLDAAMGREATAPPPNPPLGELSSSMSDPAPASSWSASGPRPTRPDSRDPSSDEPVARWAPSSKPHIRTPTSR